MWHHAPNATLNMFKNLQVLVQRFPFGPHIQDPFLVVLQNEFPLLLMLSFICVELIIISSILLEKEKKLKVALSTQGKDRAMGRMRMKYLGGLRPKQVEGFVSLR